MVLTPLIRGLLGIDVDAPARRVTLAPHLPPDWDSVAVSNVPVGRGSISFIVRRTAGALTAAVRRSGGDRLPLEIVFSPALPLGARAVAAGTAPEPTGGDVHATVRGRLIDSVALRVPFTGGWSIMPPTMPALSGSRSRAPRVLSERLVSDGSTGERYVVSLEGLTGARYRFRLRAPEEASRALAARASVGATVTLAPSVAGSTERTVEITFPTAGANPDGYTSAMVTFGRAAPP
jgi:hypothetical protein